MNRDGEIASRSRRAMCWSEPDPHSLVAERSVLEPRSVPRCLRCEETLRFDREQFDLRGAAAALLARHTRFGHFAGGDEELERFVAAPDIFRSFKARQALYRAVGADEDFLRVYDRLVQQVVLPRLKRRLAEHAGAEHAGAEGEGAGAGAEAATRRRFHYQHPPTMRVQPGPSEEFGPTHSDEDYGHTCAEVNFWTPLTDPAQTRTTLWLESAPGADDFRPLELAMGELASFHGAKCRHRAPPNGSEYTRVSLDFRVGVSPWFDPERPVGTKATHTWRECWL